MPADVKVGCENFADLPDDQADAMYEERDRAQEALDDAEGRATHLLETSKVLAQRRGSQTYLPA